MVENEITGFTDEGEEREIKESRPFQKIERTPGKRDVTDFDIVKEQLRDKIKTKITKKIKKKAKISKSIQKAIIAGAKARRKAALQAEIGRQRLLQSLVSKKRRVSILARVEDRIPNVLIKKRSEEIKPTFFSKGGLL